MKFIQLNTPNNEPRILEMGKEVFIVRYDTDLDGGGYDLTKLEDIDEKTICYLMDCYQERALIEIDGWCEFDVAEIPSEMTTTGQNDFLLIDTLTFFDQLMYANFDDYINHGSIFTPENQSKYPELYQQALEIINQKK